MDLDKVIENIKQLLKSRKGRILALLFALGAAVLVFSLFASSGEAADGEITSQTYEKELEERLAALCSDVDGAGKCRVMISFSEGERREYKGGELIYSTPPRVQGVTVLCRGADSASVRAAISDLVSALYGIGSNRICVLKLS